MDMTRGLLSYRNFANLCTSTLHLGASFSFSNLHPLQNYAMGAFFLSLWQDIAFSCVIFVAEFVAAGATGQTTTDELVYYREMRQRCVPHFFICEFPLARIGIDRYNLFRYHLSKEKFFLENANFIRILVQICTKLRFMKVNSSFSATIRLTTVSKKRGTQQVRIRWLYCRVCLMYRISIVYLSCIYRVSIVYLSYLLAVCTLSCWPAALLETACWWLPSSPLSATIKVHRTFM